MSRPQGASDPPAAHDAWWHLGRAEQLLDMAAGPENFSTVEYLVLRAHAHRELARTIQEILLMQPAPAHHAVSGGGAVGGGGQGSSSTGGSGGHWRPA